MTGRRYIAAGLALAIAALLGTRFTSPKIALFVGVCTAVLIVAFGTTAPKGRD